MGAIKIIIHGDLNHFSEKKWKDHLIDYVFDEKISLKHILEAEGIPHPEVGFVRIGNREIQLDYHVQDGDVIDVYPYNAKYNSLKPEEMRFILDNHLGKLCDYLRLLGFDSLYDPDWVDETLAELGDQQNRILLTRDRGLLKRKRVHRGYCVREDDPHEQVDEIIQHFGLENAVKPLRRCSRCNGLLEKVDKQEILDQLQPLTRKYYDEFMRCPDCGQIYWKGSHYDRMQEFIAKYSPKNQE